MIFLLICIPIVVVSFLFGRLLGPYKGFAAIASVLLAVIAVMFVKMGAEALLVVAYSGALLLPIVFGFLLGLEFRPKK